MLSADNCCDTRRLRCWSTPYSACIKRTVSEATYGDTMWFVVRLKLRSKTWFRDYFLLKYAQQPGVLLDYDSGFKESRNYYEVTAIWPMQHFAKVFRGTRPTDSWLHLFFIQQVQPRWQTSGSHDKHFLIRWARIARIEIYEILDRLTRRVLNFAS